jgi:hypothetical protein
MMRHRVATAEDYKHRSGWHITSAPYSFEDLKELYGRATAKQPGASNSRRGEKAAEAQFTSAGESEERK